jgi:hypothetical protein
MNFLETLQSSGFAVWVRESNSIWAFPSILTFHTFGMMVLVGTSMVVDMRLLGIARQIPIASMRVLFRIMWAAFWLNLVTGLILFAADAVTKSTSWLFGVKLVLVITGVVTMRQMQRRLYPESTTAPVTTGGLRNLAVASLVVWLAAVTAGRLLAYV